MFEVVNAELNATPSTDEGTSLPHKHLSLTFERARKFRTGKAAVPAVPNNDRLASQTGLKRHPTRSPEMWSKTHQNSAHTTPGDSLGFLFRGKTVFLNYVLQQAPDRTLALFEFQWRMYLSYNL
jgi:hypothetical protein